MPEGTNDNEEERAKKAYARRLRALQMEQQRREVARKFLTTDAYERLMNVRLANHELYEQTINIIISMAQSNRITAKITEAQLTDILTRLTYRPEPKIEFKHK